MADILAAPPGAFLFITVLCFGGFAFMTGQGLAESWKPEWNVASYTLLLTVGDRFLIYALGGGTLLSLWGFVLHGALLGAVTLGAYRMARARRMVSQYPWLYERSGPFAWRSKA